MLGIFAPSSLNCIASTDRLPPVRLRLSGRRAGHNCEAEAVIHGVPEVLLASQVSFGRLHRGMGEQELNLLQFASARMAKLCAGSPEIIGAMRSSPAFS